MYNYKQTFNPHTIKKQPFSEFMKDNEKLVWYEEKKSTKTDNHKPIKKEENER